MPVKVRKQIYIEAEQERRLQQLSSESGVSQAEIIRQAIDDQTRDLRAGHPDLAAWEQERAFIAARQSQGLLPGGRTWKHEDPNER